MLQAQASFYFSQQIFNFRSNLWALFDETAEEFTSIT